MQGHLKEERKREMCDSEPSTATGDMRPCREDDLDLQEGETKNMDGIRKH